MKDIPLNKALVAVESNGKGDFRCRGCFFRIAKYLCQVTSLACQRDEREDGKDVVFKLIDLPERAGKTYLEAVVDRAKRLGVPDIRLNGNWSINALEYMERTLDIIEQNKERLDGNIGE